MHTDSSQSKRDSLWESIWRRLTGPSAAIAPGEAHRRAQLLSALLVVLLPLAIYANIIDVLVHHNNIDWSSLDVALSVGSVVFVAFMYGLSRTRHYLLAARLLVVTLSILLFALAVPQKNPHDVDILVYLISPVLLSSIMLSFRETVILIAAQVAGMLIFPALFSTVSTENMWTGFVLSSSLMILLASRYAVRMERDRQAKLIEAKERYQQLVEQAPIAIAVFDGEQFRYVNPAGQRLLGVSAMDDIANRPVIDLLPPEDRARFMAEMADFGQRGTTVESPSWRVVRPDGEIIDLEVSSIPFGVDGQRGTQVIARDVTAQKRAEEALRRSESQTRALLDAMPDLMFRLDHEGRFISYKSAAIGLLYSPDTFIGRSIYEMFPSLAPQTMAKVQQARATGDVQIFEYQLPVQDDMHDYEARIVADETNAVIIVRDITERKRAEQALKRRDSILQTLADVGERLLKPGPLDNALPGILENLGTVLEVNRAYVFENFRHDDALYARKLAEWALPGHTTPLATWQALPLETGFKQWRDDLAQGRAVHGQPGDLDGAARSAMDDYGTRSLLLVPILVDGAWWGIMGFDDCERPRQWQTAEIEALRSVAGALGAAIARQRSEIAEREQRALAEALAKIAASLSRTLKPDEVLDHILVSLTTVVPHDAANIMLINQDRAQVTRHRGYAQRGLTDSIAFDVHQTMPMRDVIADRQPVLLGDTRAYPAWQWQPGTAWIRSHMAAPIQLDGQVIGLLNADSATPNFFTPEDLKRLQVFANQAAVAIENARLFDETRRYAEELEALNRATAFLYTPLSASADLETTGSQIVQAVVDVFKKVDCGLILCDWATNQFIPLKRGGEYQVACPKLITIGGPGLIPAAVRSGEPVYAPDVARDPRYVQGDPRTRSELVIPLRATKGVIGVLDLQSTEPDAFTDQDRRMLGAFAERAAAAIENRQLYAEIRHYADELEQRVHERTIDLSVRNAVAQTLSSSLNTDEMLNGVLATTVEQLGVLGGAIYLLAEDLESLEMVAHYGVSPQTLTLVTGITPGGSDLGAISGMASLQDLPQQTGISAVLSVPIWRQEQVQGVITLVNDAPRPWSSEETRMIDAIGRQIGGALANARLYGEAVEGEARIRTTWESVADGLLMFDEQAAPILINPAAARLFAFYPDVQQAAAKFWDWLQARAPLDTVEFDLPVDPVDSSHGQDAAQRYGIQNCALAAHSDPAWPCWLMPESQEDDPVCPIYQRIPRRAMQARRAPVRNADGDVVGTVIVLHDVTHFRELEELKSRFVSTVSHELRTPLSAVMLQVSTLNKYYDRIVENERRQMVRDIQRQAYVLRELIEDILELSRFDAKRAMPQKELFDLSDHCREALAALRPNIDEKRLRIDVTRLEDNVFVMGDPAQLMRAFRNLISNAIKYTPESGSITVMLAAEGGDITLKVQDNGIGIPHDEQVYVFDRFFRAESASRMASGTGLGLSITREIVDLHGGRVGLHSEPGQGSTFTIILPAPDPYASQDERKSLEHFAP